MNEIIDWQAIAKPLDVFDIPVPRHILRRWETYKRTESGVRFRCRMANDQPVDFWVDVVMDDVIRIRTNIETVRNEAASDILLKESWPAPAFDLQEDENALTLSTKRLRVVFQKHPWQMRAYDIEDKDTPFFRQRIDDRAYGPAYEVAPIGWEKSASGDFSARETVAVMPGEAFYGFGEKFTSLDKWGQEIISWAVDSGNVTSHRSYKNVPFFMSSAGYGIFVHSSYPIVYRIGTQSSISYSFHVAETQLDYFLIRGPSFKHILARYGDLTGHAPVPPKWSFGFWISRAGYKTREEVEATIKEMRTRDFPCDVISLDPWWMGDCAWCTLEWDETQFTKPAEMIANLRAQGVRTCLWITPYIPINTPLYEEGADNNYFITKPNGELAPVMEAFAGGELAAVDFTNPAAEAWYLNKLDDLLDMGVAVFKTDFGEQAPIDALYHDGRSGLEMHNLYPLLYNRAVFNLTKKKFGRGLTWGRSAYAGSQRYPVQWGGDSYASLDQMGGQLRALLSYGMSGVPFCSHDVGGFDYSPHAFDQDDTPEVGDHITDFERLLTFPKDPTVYIRWMQFGVFSSHIRAHGKTAHEPWTYGKEAERIARKYLKLRYRLLPYIYSQAVRSSKTGIPVVRPMVLEFQNDPNTHRLDMQYMFGDSFLVAPITSPANRTRVYLPAGDWVDYWTKDLVKGERWLDIEAPLDTLPLWVRAGSIIAMGPETPHTGAQPLDPLHIEIYYPQAKGSTPVYEEDKPDIPVSYRRTAGKLTVKVGAAPGEVEIVVHDTTTQRTRADGQAGLEVQFDLPRG